MPLQLPARASTGIPGLDEVLRGGLPRDHIYLLQGDPGAGKTTIGIQFLLEGKKRGEKCLYIALSETLTEIQTVVHSHGWDLQGIDVIELSALDQSTGMESENTLFQPSEVELHETTRILLAHVERIQPDRVVFDSLSELRLLAQSALRYRRQILGLKQYFSDKKTTVMLLDDRTSETNDQQLQSLAHGVLSLQQTAPVYGEDRRQLRVLKLRGVRFRGGYHDFTIGTGGVNVYPRLVASEHKVEYDRGQLSSGVVPLDALLGGGLDTGTATLIMGPAGTGKSSVAVQYAVAAARRGERVAMFIFDERIATVRQRTKALGIDFDELIASGTLTIQQIDPAEMGPGEFAHCARESVEEHDAKVVVVDSLNGYLHSMSDQRLLSMQLHELLAYLSHRGTTTILVMAQHGLVGSTMQSPVDVSYLADTVLLLRYFEAAGRIRKAISVMKKRSGPHENTIRELTLDGKGVKVGEPLEQFTGVLTGVPRFLGTLEELKAQ
jgi:circadian clock protein KaiC